MNQFIALLGNSQFQSIAFTQLLAVFASNLLIPILPVFFKLSGFSESEIGLLMGITALGAVIVRPWVGMSVDTKGPKLIVMVGLAFSALAIGGYLFFVSFVALMVLRFFHGIASAVFGTSTVTFASGIDIKDHSGSAIALFSVFTMVGVGFGTSVAPSLFSKLDFDGVIIICLVVLGLAALFMQLRAAPIAPGNPAGRVPFREVLQSKAVWAPAVCMFASNFALSTSFTFVPLVALKNNIGSYSLFYLAFTVSVVSSRLFVQYITGLWSTVNTAFFASLVNVASVLILALNVSVHSFAVSGILIGIGFGIIFPSLAVYVVSHNPSNKGTALAILTASGDFGNALGASILGFVAELYGFPALFAVSGAVVLLCTYGYYSVLVRRNNIVAAD